jgi:hypothetical protein
VITGYHAHLDPAAVKASLLVFVEISLAYKSGDIFEEFRRAALKLPNVLECHLVSGDFDYLLKARISEMASYRKLLGSTLLTLPHVRESKSYIVMEEVKETLSLPIRIEGQQVGARARGAGSDPGAVSAAEGASRALLLLLAALVRLLLVHLLLLLLLLLLRVAALRFLAGMTVLLVFMIAIQWTKDMRRRDAGAPPKWSRNG